MTQRGDRSIIVSMRALLVIALLLQSLAAVGPARIVDAPATGGSCNCVTACCCVGESASGYGTCEVPADVCMCDADPSLPARGPAAPPPRDGKELTPFLALSLTRIAVTLPDSQSAESAFVRVQLSYATRRR